MFVAHVQAIWIGTVSCLCDTCIGGVSPHRRFHWSRLVGLGWLVCLHALWLQRLTVYPELDSGQVLLLVETQLARVKVGLDLGQVEDGYQ